MDFWRGRRRDRITWDPGPEAQEVLVSWRGVVIRGMVRSAWIQNIFWKESCQDLLMDWM